MRVAQLAKAAAVSSETVRHYTDLGLLRPTRNPDNGYQEYSSTDLQRLRFIARARRLGFSLKDSQQILASADNGDAPCAEVRDLLSERLVSLQAHIEECQRLALVMQNAFADWADKGECAPDGQAICHLIEDFEPDIERRPTMPCPAH
ncbi:MerR family transcriptional regulator [Pseudomonas sp.]|uniref:MerR family transcriptional regulator n=1 Tax=Pseudomonas sp. TaxID=306 RepID=UPI003BB5F3B4